MPTSTPHRARTLQPLQPLARIVSWLGEVMDLFAEVDRQVFEARARYPLAD